MLRIEKIFLKVSVFKRHNETNVNKLFILVLDQYNLNLTVLMFNWCTYYFFMLLLMVYVFIGVCTNSVSHLPIHAVNSGFLITCGFQYIAYAIS